MQSGWRIDVHQHLLPTEFLAALERHGMSQWAPVTWTAAAALAAMDGQEIGTGMLSLSTPGTHFGDDAEARLLSRQINERLAELVKGRPDRFGMFASIPLPDIDGSLEAIRHAYDELFTDGVVLLASNQEIYLGDPVFDPVMAELDRRSAVIFIHPTHLAGPPVPGVHPALADFLLTTTRAAINMALRGVPRRFPNLKIILPHGGGFLPYAAYRIANRAANARGPGVTTASIVEDLSSFYFDTALSSSPTALPSLLKFARPGHVVFGSDWPYCLDTFFTDTLDEYELVDAAERSAINRGNAEQLFPRLVQRFI